MKTYLSILLSFFYISSFCQTTINVDASFTLGDDLPAVEVDVFAVFYDEEDAVVITQTDADGNIQFSKLLQGPESGCFDIVYYDCDGNIVFEEGCYDADNTSFSFDFDYCVSDAPLCFSAIQEYGNNGDLVTLTVFNFGVGPYTYAWDNGQTGKTISVPEDTLRTYCVTVTHGNGCITESCIDIGFISNDCVAFIYDIDLGDALFLFADAHSIDPFTYEWSDGSTNQFLYPTESGEYCVTITDGNDCESSACYTVELLPGQNECFTFINEELVTDSIANLTATSFGSGPFTYVWRFDDQVIGTDNTILAEQEGVYCVTSTSADSCIYEACYEFEITSPCEVFIVQSPSIESATLYAYSASQGHLDYLWSTGETERFITVFENEEYCVTITDQEGCVDTECMIAEINGLQSCFTELSIDYQDSIAIITANTAGESDFSFLWSTGDTTQSITVTENEVYCIEVMDNNSGCYFSTCVHVDFTLFSDCTAFINITEQTDTFATLEAVFFNNNQTAPDGTSYLWEGGDTSTTITVTENGIYCVTISDGADCQAVACMDVLLGDNFFDDGIWVYFYDEDTNGGLEATIELYSYGEDSVLNLLTTVPPSDLLGVPGLYYLDTVINESFIALAKPIQDEIYAPTYSLSTPLWEDAVWYNGSDAEFDIIGIEIRVIKIEDIDNGEGVIDGQANESAFQDLSVSDDSRDGDPLAEANIMLMHSNIMVGQLYTHDDGSFRFDKLPYGTYTLVLERPGYPAESIEVTLSAENDEVDVVFGEQVTNAIDLAPADIDIVAYPNPTTGIVNLLLPNKSIVNTENIQVNDINGRAVLAPVSIRDSRLSIDLSVLPNGIYLIQLLDGNNLSNTKVIKI